MKRSPHSHITAADMKLVVDQVLDALRQQLDRRQELQARHIINYNPQILKTRNPTTVGSYPFHTSFPKTPALSFGQVVASFSSVSDFFIVQPYVAKWNTDSGGINGFDLGVYALVPVPPNLTNHQIMYNLRGKASAYKDNRVTPNWNQAYDNNKAGHLKADNGTLETS